MPKYHKRFSEVSKHCLIPQPDYSLQVPTTVMLLKREPSFEYIFSSLATIPLPSPNCSPPAQQPTFSALPAEIHSLILPHLPYPDALSLKYTSVYFYTLVDTSIRLKVAWLIDRHTRGLPCPQKKCILKTDAAFCESSGGQVWKLMEKRRRHEECGIDRCEVLVGRKCDVAAWKGRTREVTGGMMGADHCMHGIHPRLVAMAAPIIVFSVLVNVGLGMGMYLK